MATTQVFIPNGKRSRDILKYTKLYFIFSFYLAAFVFMFEIMLGRLIALIIDIPNPFVIPIVLFLMSFLLLMAHFMIYGAEDGEVVYYAHGRQGS